MSLPELVIVFIAVAVGSVVNGVSGLGPSVIAVPIIGSFVGVETAVVIFVAPGFIANAMVVHRHRAELPHTQNLAAVVVPGALGAALGSLALTSANEGLLAVVVAILVVGYAALFMASPTFSVPPKTARSLSPVVGVVAGIMQGTAGFCGPVIGSWFHAFRLRRGIYLVSVTTIFALLGAAQMVALILLGRFTWARVGAAALATAVVFLFVPVGMRLAGRLSRAVFDRVVVLLLVVSAAWLVIDTNW